MSPLHLCTSAGGRTSSHRSSDPIGRNWRTIFAPLQTCKKDITQATIQVVAVKNIREKNSQAKETEKDSLKLLPRSEPFKTMVHTMLAFAWLPRFHRSCPGASFSPVFDTLLVRLFGLRQTSMNFVARFMAHCRGLVPWHFHQGQRT